MKKIMFTLAAFALVGTSAMAAPIEPCHEYRGNWVGAPTRSCEVSITAGGYKARTPFVPHDCDHEPKPAKV